MMVLKPVKPMVYLLCLFLFTVFMHGCAKRALNATPMEPDVVIEEEAVIVDAEKELEPITKEKVAGTFGSDTELADDQGVQQQRMLHHDGYMQLRTPQPEKLLQAAVRTVQAVGGYVERMDTARAVFRIPVRQFKETFTTLLDLGDVLEKSITTQDITESFMDRQLRLNIAETTRRRLVELLAKAKTEKEKLKLLKLIERINERIEQLIVQRDILQAMAQYSRITLEVVARELGASRRSDRDIAVLTWIHDLSPFRRDVAMQGKALKFEAPKEMVVLDQKDFWIAESADGVVFWASRRESQIKGDTDFWVEAIRLRLSPEFAITEAQQVGGFKLLRFKDRSEKPYYYLVGVRVTKNWKLDVVEAYYPSEQHLQRYGDAIINAIEKGAK